MAGRLPEETKKGVVFPAPGTARAEGQRQKRPRTGLSPRPLCARSMEQMAGSVTSSLAGLPRLFAEPLPAEGAT